MTTNHRFFFNCQRRDALTFEVSGRRWRRRGVFLCTLNKCASLIPTKDWQIIRGRLFFFFLIFPAHFLKENLCWPSWELCRLNASFLDNSAPMQQQMLRSIQLLCTSHAPYVTTMAAFNSAIVLFCAKCQPCCPSRRLPLILVQDSPLGPLVKVFFLRLALTEWPFNNIRPMTLWKTPWRHIMTHLDASFFFFFFSRRARAPFRSPFASHFTTRSIPL